MRSAFLNFSPPLIGEDEIAEVAATLRSGWITTGPKVARFEQAFAAYVGAPGALALSSCTAALHVALVTAGVGPGDIVITTPMTFCSSVHVIEHVGARPWLVDVEPDTLNIDPQKIDDALRMARGRAGGGDVRAVLPVHLYGHPVNLDAVMHLAREHQLAMIEDAAHALPARYRNRFIGAGDPQAEVPRFTCFSFYATKNVTTGEGGMLIPPPEMLDEARVWSLHGMSRDAYRRYTAEGSWFYDVVHPGFKYNITDLQAAIGLHQLARLSGFQRRRREIVRRYTEALSVYDELSLPVERPDVEHAWHLYPLRLNLDRFPSAEPATERRAVRSQFIEQLKARNIGASVHFIPVHLHRYYREKYGHRPDDFPVALDAYRRLVSLPLYPAMTDADVQDVIDAVADVLTSWHR